MVVSLFFVYGYCAHCASVSVDIMASGDLVKYEIGSADDDDAIMKGSSTDEHHVIVFDANHKRKNSNVIKIPIAMNNDGVENESY